MPLINRSGIGGSGSGGGSVSAPNPTTRKTITGNYTMIEADFLGGVILDYNAATNGTITVPPGITNKEPVTIIWTGNTGQPTFVQGAGVVINSQDGKLRLRKAYSGATLIPAAVANRYELLGDMGA